MVTHNKDEGGLSLLDAVDALSTITETHWEQEPLPLEIVEEKEVNWRDAKWLRSPNKERVISRVKEIFKVILDHLRHFSNGEGETKIATDSHTLEGIKSLMVLVGEAAKKIDRFTDLFKEKHVHSITELREYKQLQDFYRRRISRTIDQALLGKWILALTQRTLREHQLKTPEEIKAMSAKHVFVDLDSVKKDTEYELFFIRKEDGSRFFSPRLIRNIKLVCDFGSHLGGEKRKDPLIDQTLWEDRFACAYAESIYKSVKPVISRYYSQIAHHKEEMWVSSVNKSVVALLLASSKTRLLSSGSSKSCIEYLADFQNYLREAIDQREFQQLVAFTPEKRTPVQDAVSKIVFAILKAIFVDASGADAVRSYIQFLLREGHEIIAEEHPTKVNTSISGHIAADFAALQKLLKNHPNGPLNKVLTLLEDGDYQLFDPYIQQLLPEVLFDLFHGVKKVSVHRLPSPTSQEFINKGQIIEEFYTLLRAMQQLEQKVLIIQLQDRTSWREHARAHVLEDLQNGSEFSNTVTVLTLPKETEFYWQEPPYADDHQLIKFKEHFCEHLLDNLTGFYFPEKISEVITDEWVEGVFDTISRIFFSSKNVLSKEGRLDFIEIFYLFLELKVLEVTKADCVYFACKDGIDISSTSAIELFVFLKFINNEVWKESDYAQIAEMLFLPALLHRERSIHAERFHRMISVIKLLDHIQSDYPNGHFGMIVKEAFTPSYLDASTLEMKTLRH